MKREVKLTKDGVWEYLIRLAATPVNLPAWTQADRRVVDHAATIVNMHGPESVTIEVEERDGGGQEADGG